MKRVVVTVSLVALMMATSISAYAGNSSVEGALRSYGDLSTFYQALVTTGVLNELNENEHYTIFAPTNVAFADIRPQTYPCFYSDQCRSQTAMILRDHIVNERHSLANLVGYGGGVQTDGPHRAHVVQTFPGDYEVDGKKILSSSEINGNMIYRIDGVMTSPQELAQFQTVNYVMPREDTLTTQKTIIQKTYNTPGQYPGGSMVPPDAAPDTTVIQTTTTRRYMDGAQ